VSHDRLIADKFPEKGDRELVAALVASLSRTMKADHVTALLHELAAPVPDGQTGQQSADYIASFIGAIGAMKHEQAAFRHWVDTASPPGDPAADATHSPPPVATPAPDHTAAARADVTKYETMLRDDPRSYWGSAVNQEAYHAALAMLHEPSPPSASGA
jgi:hypothetical protein